MQDNEPINLTYGQMSDMVNRIEQIPSLSGEGAPTTSTPAFHLGQTYIDTTTGDMYYCSEAISESGSLPEYTWELVTEETPEYVAGDNVTITDESGSMVISATDTTYSNFVGTDGTAAGTAGLVPAPATTDAGKFLKADGTWDTAGGGASYTAGDGIDITNAVISATNTGKAKVLTTADYNYPVNNPSSVALWLLEPGVYDSTDANIQVRTTTGSLARGVSVVGVEGTTVQILTVGINNESIGMCRVSRSTGSEIGRMYIERVKDTLTSTSKDSPLSAKQGKVLNDKITPSSGASAPTTSTVGELGKIYIDTTNADAYMCVAVDTVTPSYTWKQITA